MEREVNPAPPAPGIVAESTRAGRWLFRRRSHLPLVVLAALVAVVSAKPIPAGGVDAIAWWSASGIFIGLLGYLFRAYTVGEAPLGTSGRGTGEPFATALNTHGAYSTCRHPLYFGNFLMWMGIAAVVGRPAALFVVGLTFWIYYERIMIAEEHFLYRRFGRDFEEWSSRTPAFWPRPGRWTPSRHPFSLRIALDRDYAALYALVATTTVLNVARRVALGRPWLPGPTWRAYFLGGTVFYLVVHFVRRYTRILERPGARAEA